MYMKIEMMISDENKILILKNHFQKLLKNDVKQWM